MLSLWCLLLLSCLGLIEGQGSRSYLPPPATAMEPIITKQFYSISAAEEPEELQPRTRHLVIGQPRRNYRVIFIRAPSPSSDQLKYTAELAPQEERTVIYVLTRKQQELQAEDIVAPQQQQQQPEQKPDIFFIKYRTNEEAAAAQREIQTQYDQLGGNTEIAAPYVAPVQSVVGTLGSAQQSSGSATDSGSEGYHYQRPLSQSQLLPLSMLVAPVNRLY